MERQLDNKTGQQRYPRWMDLARGPNGFPRTPKIRKPHTSEEFHIKPAVRNKLLKESKVRNRSLKRVEDLKNYIHFVKDNKN
jgi:hypothetical protein